MSISQPPFQSTLVDANDRVQTPWAQWFSQLQPILQSVVASGPTSGRPTQNLYIGYPYFDTTIDQMVYWNGVIWVTYAPSTTGTSILKGNGSGGFNNAVAGIDFAPATSGNAILYGDGAGGFSSVSIGSGVTFIGGVLSATGSGGTVTSVTGTAPIASSGGNTPAISISQAGVSTNGYLSSTDWNTFNNKGSGTVTAVTGSGNIASSGGTTPNITFTGTLPIANGGTNGTAAPTAGAVAVGNGTQYAFTAAGSAGQVLTSNGSTVPTWATVATGIGTTGYWGSFWDTTNQTAASTTVAYTINIGTSDPNNSGVSIVSSNRITVAHAGVYNIQYSIQFQNIGTGNKNYNTDVWFRLNGVDIPDSNSVYWIASKNSTINGEMIAAVNYVLSLNAGDYIQILWAVSDIDISIVTLPATSSPTVPRTPGVIVTVTPITEVGIGYYNLTSVSSVAIATGSKTFTTNLSNISTAFTVGTRVRVAYVTTTTNFMEGVITSFSGTTLVVNVDSIGGSGTYANWTISVAGIQGSNGVTSITGTTNQVIASASTGAVTLSLPQSINSGASPTFNGANFTGIPNTALTNSSITFGSTVQNLGSTVSAINGVSLGATTPSTGSFSSGSQVPLIVNSSTGVDDTIFAYTGSSSWGLSNVGRSSDNASGVRFLNSAGALELSSIFETGSGVLQFKIGNVTKGSFSSSGLTIGSLSGILKGTAGLVSTAVSGTDYAPATSGAAILYGNGSGGFSSVTIGTGVSFAAGTLSATGSGGSVTSVSFTGGLITVATATTTPAFTVAGTSGGIPYFSSASTWATSAALTANALMIGGGAGLAPATTTTGTGVLTALGTNVGSAGAFVTFNGALGTPSSGTVTNLTGTASININGTVGATTATTGKFTTLEYTSTLTGGTGIIAIGTNQIYKDASGNVGIGTTAPDKNLSVFGSSAVAAGVGGEITIGGFYDGTSKISYGSIAGVNQNGSGNTSGQLIFSTRINFGALTERMRIDSVGNVGIGTTAPNASAILDAQSTTKGVRFPNMTTTQKNAISGPAAGLVVFDTTLAKLCVFSGAAWQTITSI